MAVEFDKESELYIGAKGFQSSIFLMQIKAKIEAGGTPFEVRSVSEFEDAIKEGVQAVIIKDEDLLNGNIDIRYKNGEEAVLPEKDAKMFVLAGHTGKFILFCDDEDEEDEEDTEFDD